jgi:hypothetical protein
MAGIAAHLDDRVLPKIQFRQWVAPLPSPPNSRSQRALTQITVVCAAKFFVFCVFVSLPGSFQSNFVLDEKYFTVKSYRTCAFHRRDSGSQR